MKVHFAGILVLVVGVALAGCSHSDGESTTTMVDGVKVTTNSKGGGQVTVENNGEKSTVSSDGKTMKVETGSGTTTAGVGTEITEAEFGVAFYPGSTDKQGTSFKSENKDEKDYMVIRTTTDEPTKVVEFYKGKLKNVSSSAVNGMTIMNGTAENGATITVTIEKKEGVTEINASSSLKTKS